jgi:aerobic-type carbon monoxide dehydrogenase small subunit (CoxS/CutS family)
MRVSFDLNGEPVELDTDADALLVDVIRSRGLTGTKEACGVGVCGVCTVLVDDLPASSCLVLVGFVEGADVWTVEGVTRRDPRLLDAFVAEEGMQCGICTPGQVVSACALRLEAPDAGEEEIREFMAGNLCRCTGYASIVDSVRAYLAAE